jgi:F-type H+-transporting ATPase subunit alpha
MPVAEQVVSIFAVTEGHMDDVEIEDVPAFEKGLIDFARTRYSGVLAEITDGGLPTEDLVQIIGEYKALRGSDHGAMAAAGGEVPADVAAEEAVAGEQTTFDGEDA